MLKVGSWKDLAYVKSLIPRGDDHICSISVDEHFMFYDKSVPDPYFSFIPFFGPHLAAAADSIVLDLKHLIFRFFQASTPLWFQSIAIPLLMGPLRRPLPRLVHLQFGFDV
jgi:hypothetical protein